MTHTNASFPGRPAPALLVAALAVLWLLPAQPLLAQPKAPAYTPVSTVGLDCLIQPSQTIQVGTASAGVVESVRAERGDYVRRGQVLVQLESRVERAALDVARERAQQLGEVEAARGASNLAKRELVRAADLMKDNFVSATYYDRQRAEVAMAIGRGQQAEERRRLAQREVELAQAQLTQRTVVSPIDGVVVERHVGPGEYVEQKPVLRIAQVDPLRVDVLVPAGAFGQIQAGARAQVTPEMHGRQTHLAVVSGVDRVIDAASNTFRVRLELRNPGGQLPPGLRCKADLIAQPAAAGGAEPSRPGARAATPALPRTAPARAGEAAPAPALAAAAR